MTALTPKQGQHIKGALMRGLLRLASGELVAFKCFVEPSRRKTVQKRALKRAAALGLKVSTVLHDDAVEIHLRGIPPMRVLEAA